MKKKKKIQKFTIKMRRKLIVLFVAVLLAFIALSGKLYAINRDNGEEYTKRILSQQTYDSSTLPARRGEILDANGTVLAASEKVYNVILDTRMLLDKEEAALEPTLAALTRCFQIDESKVRAYIRDNPTSRYYILAKQLTYDEIAPFTALQDPSQDTYDANIQGVWFEEGYTRKYPNNTMACDVIGFTTSDGNGLYGLEEYYNDTLSGTPGREYGYLDEESNLERTVIPAEDGYSLMTTIDGSIQSIVERHLQEFNDEYKDNFREGNGANNVGAIVMDVNSGEILAMASYPTFNLNDTRNPDDLIGMPMVNEVGNWKGEYITAENIGTLKGDLLMQQYNALWRNFCIADTYEPGSVAKPFTVAAALEDGSITGNEVYQCNGKLEIGGWEIKCHAKYGHDQVSVERGVAVSCNVAMMYIAQATGADEFTKFQSTFGFGLRTGIDLAGEVRTENLVYKPEQMGPTELATNSFGQGFNVSMIETITAFCSLINGGYYYEPHMVRKIIGSSGATVRNIEPRVLKQTISGSTSDKIVQYCNQVVASEEGTGRTARPAGYMIGGKTGTAETLPRKNGQYVVSFMGYAPADNPQVAIYVVVDRPNVQDQDDAKFATKIVRGILTELLPYLNIPMTEELSAAEESELEELRAQYITTAVGEGAAEDGETEETTETTEEKDAEETEDDAPIWTTFERDPETGYYIDPETGNLIDPANGNEIGGSSLPEALTVAGMAVPIDGGAETQGSAADGVGGVTGGVPIDAQDNENAAKDAGTE